MKQMTKLLVFAIAIFTLNIAIAQNGPKGGPKGGGPKGGPKVRPANGKEKPLRLTSEQRATRNADSLKVRLNLTDEQHAKIVPINKAFFDGKDALKTKVKSDSTFTKESFKSEMKSLQATRKKQIDAVLTPEQKKTWSAWKKNNVVNAKANKATKVKVDEDDIDAIQD